MFLLLLGLSLGLATALLRERLYSSLRRRGQLEGLLNVAELAVIPPVVTRRRSLPGGRQRSPRHRVATTGEHGRVAAGPRLGDGLVAASDVHSIAAEAYRLLRTNLLFSLPSGPLRSVLVTSPSPGDGKTTVAANLAIAFAHQGMRVLLVDADLRRGRIHDLFHVARDPGLSQVLQGSISLEAATHPTPVTGLYALTTGRLPDSPNELVGTEAMRSILQTAAQEFAVLIIDSPPVLAASDAAVIATITDATVIVVRAGRTHEEEAQSTLSQLTAVGANVVGAVLNDPDAAVRANGGYYYYQYYGKAQ
jgi:capsular exopolysaccharide synthesis family protein